MEDELFIDTNIVLRYLLDDVPHQSQAARELFRAASQGEVRLWYCESVLFEAEYVLRSSLGFTRQWIHNSFESILGVPNVAYVGSASIDDVLHLYSTYNNLSWADCYHSVLARASAARTIISYDKKINNVPGLTRLEPSDVLLSR